MATNPIEEEPTPKSIAAYVKSNAARARKAQQMHHGESVVTREADYKGHHIVVRTKYEVEVDGRPLMGHMGVSDAGSVHYHPVPNLSFASALDMVRKIIDVFPDDFGPGAGPGPMTGMDHTSHEMPGMAMRKKRPAAKKVAKPASKRKS
jgi:hypothetical protein